MPSKSVCVGRGGRAAVWWLGQGLCSTPVRTWPRPGCGQHPESFQPQLLGDSVPKEVHVLRAEPHTAKETAEQLRGGF